MRGAKRLPKQVLQAVQSSASSFNRQYPSILLRPSSIRLLLLPSLPVSSIIPSIFPSITCFRKQFLNIPPPIKLLFLLITVCRIFLCFLTTCNTSPDLIKVSFMITDCFVLANRRSKYYQIAYSLYRNLCLITYRLLTVIQSCGVYTYSHENNNITISGNI